MSTRRDIRALARVTHRRLKRRQIHVHYSLVWIITKTVLDILLVEHLTKVRDRFISRYFLSNLSDADALMDRLVAYMCVLYPKRFYKERQLRIGRPVPPIQKDNPAPEEVAALYRLLGEAQARGDQWAVRAIERSLWIICGRALGGDARRKNLVNLGLVSRPPTTRVSVGRVPQSVVGPGIGCGYIAPPRAVPLAARGHEK